MNEIEWKFVEDNEYPEAGTRVLVWFPAYSTSVMDALYDHDGRFYVDGIDRTKVVVCWRYLPSNEEMEFIRKQYRKEKESRDDRERTVQ